MSSVAWGDVNIEKLEAFDVLVIKIQYDIRENKNSFQVSRFLKMQQEILPSI